MALYPAPGFELPPWLRLFFSRNGTKESAIDSPCGFRSRSVVFVQQIADGAFKTGRKVTMTQLDTHEREAGTVFAPKFDAAGLLTAIVIDSVTKDVLMVAFMDAEALAKTRETGLAHFHSRSRGRLWLKGETSGHFLRVQEIRVDCDQDALVVIARPEGPACHTGAVSCFYRRLEGDTLTRMD